MKPEELSEGIRNGINKSRSDLYKELFKSILIVAGIVLAVLIILIMLGRYQNYKWEKENCGENGCPVPTVAAIPDSCDKPWVHCRIFDDEPRVVFEKSFCGYSEANAWFKQYKEQMQEDITMECDD